MAKKSGDKKSTSKKNADIKRTNKATKKSESASILPGEDDLDTVLAQFYSKLALQNSKITTEKSSPTTEESLANISDSGVPSPRLYASFIPHPASNQRELYLFGGEYFNGKHSSFFADFYRYLIDKKEWRQILPSAPPVDTTKNSTKSSISKGSPNDSTWPGPRSSHQMVGINNSEGGALWMFGGEFSSTKESQFHHYRDLWRFGLKQRRWEQVIIPKRSNKNIPSSPGSLTATKTDCPSARSGHRMVAWRHYLILFGGFYDNYFDMKYYNDLWAFDTKNLFWMKLVGDDPTNSRIWPAARSGFLFLTFPLDDMIFLHGGYVKKSNDQGQTLSDSYILHLSESKRQGTLNAAWEKIRIHGFPANNELPRSGMSAIVHKNKAIIFGGVSDQQISGSNSLPLTTFYNDLTVLHLKSKRAFRINLTSKLQQSKSFSVEKRNKKNTKTEKGLDLNFPLYLNEFPDDENFSGEDYGSIGFESKESPTMPKEPLNLGSRTGEFYTTIHPRYNAMMAIHGQDIFLYGGKFEQECALEEPDSSSSDDESENSDSAHSEMDDMDVREWTMDDMYKLTVDRWEAGGWECLQGSTAENQKWFETKDDDLVDKSQITMQNIKKIPTSSESSDTESLSIESLEEDAELAKDPNIISEPLFIYVLPNEPLREYVSRSMEYWMNKVRSGNLQMYRSVKELRSDAFALAKAYYDSSHSHIVSDDLNAIPSRSAKPPQSSPGDHIVRKIR